LSGAPEQVSTPRPQETGLKEELERLDLTLRRVGLTGLLSQNGFDVDADIPNLPTAFVARRVFGRGGPPRVGFFCEYDALPELGHACGHNLIASASLVAGLALAKSVDANHGEVWVIGSPAEETFGGKISLLRGGRLKGLDAAMMFHPGPETRVLSVASAATEPTEIVFCAEQIPGLVYETPSNPVLAVVNLFQLLSAATSQFPDDVRSPGVIIEGGQRPNVIPARAVARFSFRAKSRPLLRRFMNEVIVCVRGAARDSGCSFSMRRFEAAYEPIVVNEAIGRICEEYLRDEGLAPSPALPKTLGAYDIGAVSRHIPVIHPIISRGFENLLTHTTEFRDAAGAAKGMECARVAARVLALTALRLYIPEGMA